MKKYSGPNTMAALASKIKSMFSETNGNIGTMSDLETSSKSSLVAAVNEIYNNMFLAAHPVNSVLITTNSTNPGTLYGGTWVSWGSGRVPVGVDSDDSALSAAEKTGGAKTISLIHSHTVNSHNHTISHTHTVNAHTHSTGNHTLTSSEIPSHSHEVLISMKNAGGDGFQIRPLSGSNGSNGYYKNLDMSSNTIIEGGASSLYSGSAGGGGAHNHGNTGSASPATGGASTSNSGSASPGTNSQLSSSQSIMQPYITCYMWKRTA